MKSKMSDLAERSFRVGPWLVETRLNRISRGDTTIQLETRIMDVLIFLASRAGELVSRREIIDSVWATEVISDNTLTHTIAEVRNALGDDAKDPAFVETIHRRGYRLIAPVSQDDLPLGDVSSPIAESGQAAVMDDARPYPGLSAFVESDAEFFFGREIEVARMWRKLISRKLLAVIGASGVGKSSFLRAGVVPAQPKDWGVVVCEPGEAPFAALARALVPEFVDERAAISKLVHLKESGEAVAMASRWRNRYACALLIVDQFEEFFTLNPTHIQIKFTDLLRRLVDEADVHVVLGVRDDYLHRCHDTGRLAPIFDSLTAITPPVGDALRRALVEPARRLGYSFETDRLVDEMVASVEGERGALPLIAFAVARLWDLRDRENRLLTWHAYEEIGGVGGALAGHAEATLRALGNDRVPMVREFFRNLFTADGSRLVRSVDDLLSIFDRHQPLSSTNPTAGMIPAREAAAGVLNHLCDARLLTCFEEEGENSQNQSRVEVVHESLLTSWPRLVSWRSQDIEDARYRDEFRQAAQLWVDRNRSPDLLWTGAAFSEFRLWRQRFTGGLCAIEGEFARELTAHAKRRKRRRRTVAASVVVMAMILTVVFWALWRQSLEVVRRAKSIELLALGASYLDSDPNQNCSSTALAYSIASLETDDTPEARSLAVRALWSGSVGFAFNNGGRWVSFAANDQRLVAKTAGSDVEVYDRKQGLIGTIQDDFVNRLRSTFAVISTRDAESVGIWDSFSGVYGQLSVLQMRLDRHLNIGAKVFPLMADSKGVFTLEFRDGSVIGKSWAGDTDRPTVVGAADGGYFSFPRGMPFGFSNGNVVGSFSGGDVWMHSLAEWGDQPTLFARHDSDVIWGAFDPTGNLLATGDEDGIIKIWRLSERGAEPVRVLRGPRRIRSMSFDNEGAHFAAAGVADRSSWVWNLHGPPTADPWIIGGGADRAVSRVMLSGDGQWLVSSHALGESGFLWPVEMGRPHVLESDTDIVGSAVFLADGSRIVAAVRDGSIRSWPMSSTAGFESSTLFELPSGHASDLAADPSGRYVLAAGTGGAWLVPTESGPARRLVPPSLDISGAAFSNDGKLAATSAVEDSGGRSRVLRVWNLETGEVHISDGVEHPVGGTCRLEFSPDGSQLYASIASALYVWDLTKRSLRPIEGEGISIAIAPEGREIFTAGNTVYPTRETNVYDPDKETSRVLAGHVDTTSIALDPEGTLVVTGSVDGTIRVSPADGGEPHLLLGHRQAVDVSVSPDGLWIVSTSLDGTMCLWRVPDISKPPLHTLPGEELIAKLKALTNLRVVHDEQSATGWKTEVVPFPGWETVPEW